MGGSSHRRQALSRPWDNELLPEGGPQSTGVCPGDTLHCQLSCQRRVQGWDGNKKPCSPTCSRGVPKKLPTDQWRMHGVRFLIKRSFAPSNARRGCPPRLQSVRPIGAGLRAKSWRSSFSRKPRRLHPALSIHVLLHPRETLERVPPPPALHHWAGTAECWELRA